MKVKIEPGKANGRAVVPPSKSISHRYLILSAFAEGESTIENISVSDDIRATSECLDAFIEGSKDYDPDEFNIRKDDNGATFVDGAIELDCHESGSTLRFMIPMVLLTDRACVFTGRGKLLERPLDEYEELCREKGMIFAKGSEAVLVKGRLIPGEYRLRGDTSSQFASGLLMALPLLEGDSTIVFTKKAESRSYIDITMDAVNSFGGSVNWVDDQTISIKGGAHYTAKDLCVEGDHSQAAFLEALNVAGGNVEIEGLRMDSFQGDRVYKELFEKLKEGYCSIDVTDCPDLAPILFTVASFCHGASFTGTRRLRLKESDRVLCVKEELSKFGVRMNCREDSVEVEPCSIEKMRAAAAKMEAAGTALYGHNDHRIVMSLAVLLTLTGGMIEGAEAVRKSYPTFFNVLSSLGIECSLASEVWEQIGEAL